MKKLFTAIALVVLSFGYMAAQGNAGGNSSNGSSAFSSSQWPNFVTQWLNNGGDVPALLRNRVFTEARPWFLQNFNWGPSQVLQRYAQGQIALNFLPVSPPSPVLSFRVAAGGIETVILIDGL